MTSDQFPGELCRKSRAEGYQGLSVRSISQRQSAAYGRRTQTGFPILPAKCAIEVSTVITRSISAIWAAVSAISMLEEHRSCNCRSEATSAISTGEGSFIKEE